MRSLYLTGLFLGLLCVAIQWGAWIFWRRDRALLLWGLANLTGAVAAVLIALRSDPPGWVTTGFANTLLLASSFVLWSGMRVFAGRRIPYGWFAAMIVLFFAVFQGVPAVREDVGMRVLWTSVGLGLANGAIAVELLSAQQAEPLRMRSLLVWVFVLHAFFFLFRSATAATMEPNVDFLRPNIIQELTMVVGIVKFMIWNGLVLLMLRERLRHPTLTMRA